MLFLLQLNREDSWFCPHCKHQQQDATKKITLWTLPDVLVVHLKRFRHVSSTIIMHYQVVSCGVMAYQVVSGGVMHYQVVSWVSWPIKWCYGLSGGIMHYQVVSWPIKWCHALSGGVMHYQVVSCTIRWCQVVSCTIRWCHQVVSCTIKWCHMAGLEAITCQTGEGY